MSEDHVRPPLGAITLVLESVRLLLPHFPALFPLALVPALLLTGLNALIEAPQAEAPGGGMTLLVGIGWLLLSGLAILVLTAAARDAFGPGTGAPGTYLASALPRLAPLIVLGLVYLAMVSAGLLLLILPGLYLMGRFFPWIGALVYEEARWSAFDRAQRLTEGLRWPLAGAVLLFLVVAAIVPLPAMAIAAMLGGLAGLLFEAVGLAISYMLNGIFTALVYLRLRALEDEGRRTAAGAP
jgi:hypothetical protein